MPSKSFSCVGVMFDSLQMVSSHESCVDSEDISDKLLTIVLRLKIILNTIMMMMMVNFIQSEMIFSS